MPIRVIGLNSRKSPIEIRELFSFDASGVKEALSQWRVQYPTVEAAFVSTCNRTELYIATEKDDVPSYENVFPFLVAPRHKHDIPAIQPEPYERNFHCLDDFEAITHLFSVSSSLDSMILGEPQILSQMKKAYELSVRMNATGPILNYAFQTAFKTAKRVSVETEIFKRRVSIPSVAVVDFALNIFERLSDKKTFVLGAGEMAEETLKYLADYGAKSIIVANRNREKAEKLANDFKGIVVDWDRRFEVLSSADLVICATGASEPVVALNQFQEFSKTTRAARPLFILDLSVPRNIDAAIGNLPNVYLYTVDDLESACTRNKELRDQEIPKALRIIEEEADQFISKANSRKSIDAICQLRNSWSKTKDAEVERLLHKISCDQHTEEEIRYAFDRLVNKLLHSPTVSLRAAAENEAGPKLLEAMRRLFKL
ncbi:MAG: glutamyl-tRNA reductase [Thermoguttaceae bacterium]|nr:glutamyl-tRNA reductase [Thermoguttaceae bacterium]